VTSISLARSSPATLRTDAVVVGLRPGADAPVVAAGGEEVDAAFPGGLARAATALGATGKAGEVTKMAGLGVLRAPVVVAVGLGEPASDPTAGAEHEALRRAAGAAARALTGTASVALALPAHDAATAAAVAEGALLGAYAFQRYRTASLDPRRAPVEAFTLLSPGARDRTVKAGVTRAEVIAAAVNRCRDLVNTPPNDLHPQDLADAAVEASKGLDLDVEVLEDKALRKGGYGGILGVGQGSVHGPRLVRLSYRHPKATTTVALVGKGITFDSGGLSLKPPKAMEWMKADMAGAAAVICAMVALARLRPAVNVTGWAPLAENLPSGTAQRPSDVLRMYGGKTVEVLNTDAEGRLVLADALVRAAEEHPDAIVDVATLTGSQLVALGSRIAAVMANDDGLRARVESAAARAGEAVWPMPLPEDLRKSLDSDVADIANMGDRNGSMLVAGLFLRDFVPAGTPWAHLDIAGPAWNETAPQGYTPKGATGWAVRTLVALAEDAAGTR